MTAAILTAAIVAAAFIALGTIASRITKREHTRVWGLFVEADKMRRLANFERDIALARVERVLTVLDEGRGTTVSRRKIERAIG